MRIFGFALLAALSAAPVAARSPLTFARDDYAAASAPRAMVTGDFNRDGWPDLATAGTGRDSVSILLNNGHQGGFRALPEQVIGGGPFDMASGDLNRDGVPDLAIANADANAVDILIGKGDGTFPVSSRYIIAAFGTPGNPRGITLADYDRDGILDIIVTEYATGAWRILYGDGNGSIRREDRFGGIAHPQGVVAADFNHDGRVDVAMAGAGINLVAVFYSQPTGFVQRNITVGGAVNLVTYADYDKDGWLDLSAVSTSNSTIYNLRGGAAGLTWTSTLATGASPRGIAAIDVNQDGRIDLVTANRAASTVTVHPGSSQPGTFGGALTFAVGAGGRAVAVADFDRDGKIDIATANESGSSTTLLSNSTLLASPAFRFSPLRPVPSSGVSGPDELAVADFDRDGRPDVASETSSGLVVWLASRGGVSVDQKTAANDIAVADFNRDGAPDMVTSDFFGKQLHVYLNRGDGTFAQAAPLTSTLPIFGVATGDLNRDGRADVVYQANDEARREGVLRVALGRGDGTFAPAASSDTFIPFAWQIIVADMDNDGRPDVVSGGPNPSGVNIWYGRGDGTQLRMVFYELPPSALDTTVADLDEDGRLDLIGVGDNNVVQVRLALATGGFGPVAQSPATLKPSGTFTEDIGVGDINLDGHVDVITNEADVLYGRGDGTFTFDPLSTFEAGGRTATVADYNGDSLPDMLFAETGGFTALLNERGGSNRVPTVSAGPDKTVTIHDFFDDTSVDATGSDPDQHELQFQWRNAEGTVVSNDASFFPNRLPPGNYTFTVAATDGRGGQASDSMVLTVAAYEEIYFHSDSFDTVNGAWRIEPDATAATGNRLRHPDAGAPKLQAPLANPVNYIEASFPADPTQAYKLWLRLKADVNFWANDSVFVQFDGATDANGNPIFQIGSASALAINLEECSGCGLSEWGWEDEGWGAKDRTGPIVLRFPQGFGRIRIQTREDGMSVDQVVLSSRTYLTTRPGTAKNDSLIVPRTVPFD